MIRKYSFFRLWYSTWVQGADRVHTRCFAGSSKKVCVQLFSDHAHYIWRGEGRDGGNSRTPIPLYETLVNISYMKV